MYLWMTIYTLPPEWLSTLVKESTASSHVMQISSCELSTLVSGKGKRKQAKATTLCFIISERTVAEWYDTISNGKLGGF